MNQKLDNANRRVVDRGKLSPSIFPIGAIDGICLTFPPCIQMDPIAVQNDDEQTHQLLISQFSEIVGDAVAVEHVADILESCGWSLEVRLCLIVGVMLVGHSRSSYSIAT